jgi:hypothetical protein
MKNYFNFNLDAKKILFLWLAFMVFFLVPYGYLFVRFSITGTEHPQFNFLDSVSFLSVFVTMVAFYYFYVKILIESLGYKSTTMLFEGSFLTYLGKILLGTFLSIITLGIYSPWFMKDLTRYYAENSSYDSNNFTFLGRGRDLLLIFLLTLLLPMIVLMTGFTIWQLSCGETEKTLLNIIYQITLSFIMIPYMYLLYKWLIDFNYKEYHIVWKTRFWRACGRIALQMFFTVITFGIYAPMAYLQLYKYFAGKTLAISNKKEFRFGFDMENPVDDFLFMWGQILLIIFTLTIYTPWAISKVGKRFIGRTYLESEDEEIFEPEDCI